MTSVSVATISTVVVLLIMLAEAWLSRAHERTLRAQGAIEPADDVYRTMQWAYPASFIAMGVEGAVAGPLPGTSTVAGLVLLALAKGLKFWAMATLGTRWTFRVLVLPGAPLVRHGPYSVVRHPNYIAVVGEIAAMGILVGAPVTCVISALGFGALLRARIRVEQRALGG